MCAFSISDTDYPAVRRVMGEHRLRVDDDALESMLAELFPDTDPADVESFMGTLQRFGNEIAPIAQRALPGAVQGAMTGATVAGPYGALAGAALGAFGAATAPQSPAKPTAPRTPATPMPPTTAAAPMALAAPVQAPPTPVPPPAPTPGTADALTAQQAAAGAILEILTSKAGLAALQAMLLQAAGRPAIKVGDKQVPPAAFANAIAEFAAIAAEGGTAAEGTSDHLYGESGWPRGDLASPTERASILLGDLREAANDDSITAYERVAYGWRTDD
jgi:hypothetical protein